jgi:hypothetical protein
VISDALRSLYGLWTLGTLPFLTAANTAMPESSRQRTAGIHILFFKTNAPSLQIY